MPSGTLRALLNRRLAVMLFLGFASGLPLALSGALLQAWLSTEGVDIKTIGIFSLVMMPYTWKFLWSPLMDRFVPPILGRRRGWMLLTQAALVLAIAAMAFGDPTGDPAVIAIIATVIAFLSASQDIAFDAYRTDVLRAAERGTGAALSVAGYRVGMLTSGGLALIFADWLGFRGAYLVMAGAMGIGLLTTLLSPEPEVPAKAPKSLGAAVFEPLREYFSRKGAILFLLLIIFYRLGDAFAGVLTIPFLMQEVGFSPTTVGVVNKGVGLAANLGGAFLGGLIMARISLFRALLIFGVLQALTNLAFLLLAEAASTYPLTFEDMPPWLWASVGQAFAAEHYDLLVATITLENLAGGMGTAASVALLMALCDHRYTATQYALLSSVTRIGLMLFGPFSGFVVEGVGWSWFFFITTLLALPGLWLIIRLRVTIDVMVEQHEPLDTPPGGPEDGPPAPGGGLPLGGANAVATASRQLHPDPKPGEGD